MQMSRVELPLASYYMQMDALRESLGKHTHRHTHTHTQTCAYTSTHTHIGMQESHLTVCNGFLSLSLSLFSLMKVTRARAKSPSIYLSSE